MSEQIPLTSSIGEVMGPQTLVTALTVDTDGLVRLEPGALHGRSQLEQQLTWLKSRETLGESRSGWIVWTAIELDASGKPVRFKGLTVCELLVNPQSRMAYKSLAEHINRMSEAMRGSIEVSRLSAPIRGAVREQLIGLSGGLWEQSSLLLKSSLDG